MNRTVEVVSVTSRIPDRTREPLVRQFVCGATRTFLAPLHSWLDGLVKRFLYCPPDMKAGTNPRTVQPQDFAPFCQATSFTSIFELERNGMVSGLLNPSGPSTIARFVVPSLVREPVKRMFITRGMAHIFQKVGEIKPTLANCDSFTTIPSISDRIWVQASLLHHRPNRILARWLAILPPAMLSRFSYHIVSIPERCYRG
jgi:hypothetical protein